MTANVCLTSAAVCIVGWARPGGSSQRLSSTPPSGVQQLLGSPLPPGTKPAGIPNPGVWLQNIRE